MCETAAEGAAESKDSREERSKGQDGRKKGTDLSVGFFVSWGRMKALQKNQGRTDQLLGAMADLLTSVAIPNQQWVSCEPPRVGCGLGGFTGGIVELQPQQGGILFLFLSGAQRAQSRRRRASLGSRHDVPNLIHSLSKSRKT